MTSPRTGTAWIVAGIVAALAACAWVAFFPSVRAETGQLVFDGAGKLIAAYDEETFVQAHGLWAALLLPIPIALAAAPLARGASAKSTAACGAALGVLALLATVAVGPWYVPSALLLLIGAGLAEWRSLPLSL